MKLRDSLKPLFGSALNLFNKKEFIICLLFGVWVLIWYFFINSIGGPLLTGDSKSYLQFSESPWKHFGSWPAVGLPWWLLVFKIFSNDLVLFLAFIGAVNTFLVFRLLDGVFSQNTALLLSSFLLLSPQLSFIHSSLWTESLFLFHILALVLLSHSKKLSLLRLGLISFLVISAYLLRPVFIFLLPVFFAFPLLVNKTFNKAIPVVLGLVGILTINFLSTGNLLKPVKNSLDCSVRYVALNEIPMCEATNSPRVCEYDQRKFIGRTVELNILQWASDSPYNLFLNKEGSEIFCQDLKFAHRLVIKEFPWVYLNLIRKRIWHQFSRWDRVEVGTPQTQASLKQEENLGALVRRIEFTHSHQSVFRIILVLSSVILTTLWIFKLRPSPYGLTLFCLALCHSTAIAVLNPFLSLRYQAIHKFCILLAFLLLLGSALRQIRRSSKQS